MAKLKKETKAEADKMAKEVSRMYREATKNSEKAKAKAKKK